MLELHKIKIFSFIFCSKNSTTWLNNVVVFVSVVSLQIFLYYLFIFSRRFVSCCDKNSWATKIYTKTQLLEDDDTVQKDHM